MPSQIRLQFPPGLNIRQPEILKISLIGGGGDGRDFRDRQTSGGPSNQSQYQPSTSTLSTFTSVDIQPRIQNLHLPARIRARRVGTDGAFFRKKLGHAAVMAATARQRMARRRAASQAAMLARWFNLTGEWDSDSDSDSSDSSVSSFGTLVLDES